ncbi:ABC transporter ATP-binding protein [bacterium]|nr:MAG: ABC transporter ATP-binding protein [bacterium]
MRDYIRLLKFVKPYTATFILAGVCMFFSAIFDGVSLAMMVPLADKVLTNKKIIIPTKLPGFLSGLVDKINSTAPDILLNYLAVAIIILFLFKGVFGFLQSYLMSDIGQKVVRDIRGKLFEKFQNLSLEYFTHKRGGEIISRITNDVKVVENAVSYGSSDLMYQSFQVIVFLIVVFFIYFKMALIVFLMVPVISFSIISVGKMLRKLSRRGQEKMADINSLLYETILGAKIVKAFNMESYEAAKFRMVNNDFYKITMKSIKRMLLLNPATEFMGCIAGVFVFVWGGREVIAGRLSFGVFGVFLGSLLSLIRPFKKLSQVHSINEQAMAASLRIFEVMDTKPTVMEKEPPLEFNGFRDGVVFKDIWFSYGDNEILKGINLRVKKGEILAVVGPSGAGKTTLLDLIPRFYDPKSGEIFIDGINIKDFSFKSLRNNIGIVTQETILFNDTIRANIAYGDKKANNQDIERAAKQAHAHDFIRHFPLGYDTVIGDRGMKLSGGERQRIAIARALLKNPPILILDEATSQLDSESERLVQNALDDLMKGRTVFVIAHRLSTVRNASKIIVLSNGKIEEEGTHQELLNNDGLYLKLYQTQMLHNNS